MGATLGTGYVQIVPSAQGISGAITNVLSGESNIAGAKSGKILSGGMLKAFVAAGGAVAIGAAVMKGIKASLDEGAKLEQSLGGVETMFGKHADTVIKNADRAYKTAGLSANTYMEQVTSFSASLLQSLGGDTQKAAKYADMAVIDMSDNANKFGTSIEDIQHAYQGFAKQNYTMLDNLKLGYGGTKTEMQRLLADASKITGQKYDISNLSDVYEAIHVIQQEMGVTGTTAEEAAVTLSGSMASMKAAAQNFLGNLALGRDVTSSLKELGAAVWNFVSNNLLPAVGRMVLALPGLLAELPTMIANGINGNSGEIGASMGRFVGQLFIALLKALPKMAIGGMRLIFAVLSGITRARGRLASAVIKTISAPFTKAIAKIKRLFAKLKIKFPKPKTPSFSLKWKSKDFGKLGSIKYPTGFRIGWHAKGGIFDRPTLLGRNLEHGVGEAGPEAILPLTPLWKRFDQMTEAIASSGNYGGEIHVHLTLDGKEIATTTAPYMRTALGKLTTRTNRKLGYV